MLNKAILMGRMVRDPELKSTPQGVSVLAFSIAVDRNYNQNGERKADFINCVAWRQTAEFISRNFNKGKMISLVGEIQTRDWEKPEGGKGYATEVIVTEVYFAGDKKDEASEPVIPTITPDNVLMADDSDLPF